MNYLLLAFLTIFPFTKALAEFIPEASGLDQMGETLIIAGDEESQGLWLARKDLLAERVEVSGVSWDDMESLAAIDRQFFFGVTSHSLTKKAKRKPEREKLILFSLQGRKIEAQKSWSLRDQILSYLKEHLATQLDLKDVSECAPEAGGLNIEGSSYLGGTLYLGLRSPLTNDGKAIVLVVGRPLTSPQITSHHLVDLHQQGIRGLETQGGGLIILSGGSNDQGSNFGLYHFTPDEQKINPLFYPGFAQLLRPESLIAEPSGSLVLAQDFEHVENQDVLIRLERTRLIHR